jgi:hypothetical protein
LVASKNSEKFLVCQGFTNAALSYFHSSWRNKGSAKKVEFEDRSNRAGAGHVIPKNSKKVQFTAQL